MHDCATIGIFFTWFCGGGGAGRRSGRGVFYLPSLAVLFSSKNGNVSHTESFPASNLIGIYINTQGINFSMKISWAIMLIFQAALLDHKVLNDDGEQNGNCREPNKKQKCELFVTECLSSVLDKVQAGVWARGDWLLFLRWEHRTWTVWPTQFLWSSWVVVLAPSTHPESIFTVCLHVGDAEWSFWSLVYLRKELDTQSITSQAKWGQRKITSSPFD